MSKNMIHIKFENDEEVVIHPDDDFCNKVVQMWVDSKKCGQVDEPLCSPIPDDWKSK
jgi:hypothetical protein